LFLHEHWLADGQLSILAGISENMSNTAVSGYDSDDVLVGRTFGGCTILWQANLLASVCPFKVDSRRVRAVRVCFDAWNLLLINVYMPYEDGAENLDECINTLSLIEGIVDNNRDCHVIFVGDFNVDFCLDWTHTASLSSYCDDTGLMSVTRHSASAIDYSYNFSMNRFSILDHFILSGTLFEECFSNASALHDVDNLSDHDPIFLCLNTDLKFLSLRIIVFFPHAFLGSRRPKMMLIIMNLLCYIV
jgi:exonuclease III